MTADHEMGILFNRCSKWWLFPARLVTSEKPACSRANKPGMDLTGLSESEHVVLLALVGLLARADGRLSQTEMSTLEKLRRELTPERFQRIRDDAAALDDDAAVLNAARAITRPEAREAIFGVLYEMAIPDTIDPSEVTLLEKVAALWGLEPPLPD
jgi:uncharacterized tellurite resistance protein B-like protein